MIPPCWLATCGTTLKSTFDSIVQSPGAGCRTRFFAVFVAALRSPCCGVIVRCPPDSLSFVASGRTTVHIELSALSLNSSLFAARAKFSVYVYGVPSAPVEVTVAVPGTVAAWAMAIAAAGSADVAATTGTAAPSGTTTSYEYQSPANGRAELNEVSGAPLSVMPDSCATTSTTNEPVLVTPFMVTEAVTVATPSPTVRIAPDGSTAT